MVTMTYITSWAIIVLSFLGIADSAYLAEHSGSNPPPSCSLTGVFDGCRIVAESAYSHLFGIPLGVYGVVFYGTIFALAAFTLVTTFVYITRLLRIFAGIGALASAVFIYIQVFLIGALCLYCVTSAVISFLILAVVWLPIRSKMSLTPKNNS